MYSPSFGLTPFVRCNNADSNGRFDIHAALTQDEYRERADEFRELDHDEEAGGGGAAGGSSAVHERKINISLLGGDGSDQDRCGALFLFWSCGWAPFLLGLVVRTLKCMRRCGLVMRSLPHHPDLACVPSSFLLFRVAGTAAAVPEWFSQSVGKTSSDASAAGADDPFRRPLTPGGDPVLTSATVDDTPFEDDCTPTPVFVVDLLSARCHLIVGCCTAGHAVCCVHLIVCLFWCVCVCGLHREMAHFVPRLGPGADVEQYIKRKESGMLDMVAAAATATTAPSDVAAMDGIVFTAAAAGDDDDDDDSSSSSASSS